MKLLYLILFFYFYCTIATAQTLTICNCGALINPISADKIPLYNRPNGSVLKLYKNDIVKEDFLVLTILKDSANYFLVSIDNAQSEEPSLTGWIKKTNTIGTYVRNYSPKDTLFLYSKPNKKSKIQSFIPTWLNSVFTITSCSESWAYVKVKYKGRMKSGWLAPDRKCDNPYTTCN